MAPTPDSFSATASPENAGQRVDRFLAEAWPELSRARIVALIQSGDVMLTDMTERPPERALIPSAKVRGGDVFVVTPPPPTPAIPGAEAIPLVVVYEDADLIIIDKAAGMTVHPAPGQETGTLVNALLAHCGASLSGVGGVARPGIVHRIDKDTTGLLVVAKHDRAHHGLASQFEAHTVERAYRAFVWGAPSPNRGRVDIAIGRDPRDRKRIAPRPSGDGKRAVTHYRVVAPFGVAAAEIECRLETGRTHQIRVHMAYAGWPLIGDPLYGRVSRARKAKLQGAALEAALAFPRQALHAATLGFEHPISGERHTFESPLPPDMAALKAHLETCAARPI